MEELLKILEEKSILYADKATGSMQKETIEETMKEEFYSRKIINKI